jgi:deoxyribose-phosphate aldolase
LNQRDLDALTARITDEVLAKLRNKSVSARDSVCADCTGTCAGRCAYKVEDFLRAGADRIGGAPGLSTPRPHIAALIDHTILKPDATETEIDQLCEEAKAAGFASVCVNPIFVERCRRLLSGSKVKVCTVIGFPLGANLKSTKVQEARAAQDLGAMELDMVIPVGLLKSGHHDLVLDHVAGVASTLEPGVILKVILETCLLTDDEKRTACRIAVEGGAHFVKTSTGFSKGGATIADVALMRGVVGSKVGVKASGGVKDYATMRQMIDAGATRIGASAGVRIVREADA